MKLLRLTACHFMAYKGYKVSLKFIFLIREIDFRTQHLTCFLISPCVTIHHNIFLKPLPCEFPHCIIHQLLMIYFLINDLLLSKFKQARHTGGGIWAKNNLLIPCDGVFHGCSSSPFVFIQFRRGVYSTFVQVLTATSCSFIYRFCNPRQVFPQAFLFYTSKNSSSSSSSSSSSLSMLHCWFSASVYLNSSTYA